jgi:hypothetical protein
MATKLPLAVRRQLREQRRQEREAIRRYPSLFDNSLASSFRALLLML